ncbi:MAG: pyridoxal-5-phosphate-dependent protein subunit beta [Candidatus Muiribacterium halophilum]|uniref:Pyridoxal-5-phosphate-dependent protein subunit beta n=1 Tax=Muiribacterium halophilum TaxID=2053465 RepID=A0A2N5ZID9_MUIH1|nr:MAG: pyridoxal-5-phosphate-dependent protein subunit beta [Candidatus Muirbacterium halophilum]
MIELKGNREKYESAVKRAKEKKILLPTFKQMINPEEIPQKVKDKLEDVGLWDVNPLNLFRITWKNEPKKKGGKYSGVNYITLPEEITGVKAKITCLVGKWFPTGAHKVGATYGCLAPALASGNFDPIKEKAVWPSTGNYCRGGAYNSQLLGCESIAILPEEMSQERFEWLKTVAGEIIATPGCESNVKEIYDKCHELEATRDDIVIFNQFAEFGNHLWHYHVTGNAMKEVFESIKGEDDVMAGVCVTSGSAGTVGSADFMKDQYCGSKVCVSEATECPTLLNNGFGGHRIEGIGDKHIPWIHNVKNTDMVMTVDDESCMKLVRLFNDPAGREYLKEKGVDAEIVDNLDLLGISGIANVLTCIKFAKYYELGENDHVFTVLTDSMEMYNSRYKEMVDMEPEYNKAKAERDFARYIGALTTDNILECNYYDRKRIHNLKYYTWVEQQGKTYEQINQQWYDRDYWSNIHKMVNEIDDVIERFNRDTGVIEDI